MTRRIVSNLDVRLTLTPQVRTSLQLGAVLLIIGVLVLLLDDRFGVLPDAIHNALPSHHDGLVITDITVATCSTLNLLTSCRLDPNKWHRIEKDLYLSQGWLSQAYLHVQRKREVDLDDKDLIIVDIKLGTKKPPPPEADGEAWESRPAGLWLLRTPRHRAADKWQTLTAVDVLFGSDSVDARLGWSRLSPALSLSASDKEDWNPFLTVRRGPSQEVTKPTLHVRDNGKFKILQVADLHLSTGVGACRDPVPVMGEKCEADPRSLAFIVSVLESEKPDLIVLSGDQVNGETAPDAQSALFKFAALFIEHKIPYATIFGNHDDEGSLSREALMQLTTHGLPYSVSDPGPANLDGVGNYVLEVFARGHSSNSALTLYLLDTHAYSPDERQFRGYDWLKKTQIEWFKSTAQSLKSSPSHTGYKHHHMDMAFIHIPLPEYRNTADMVIPHTGSQPENPTAPGFNSGFHDALVEEGVRAVSCGHDHVNDYCSLSKNEHGIGQLWMCYAGGSGFGGYGGYGGYQRRVRLFEFDMNEARLTTWKRLEDVVTTKRVDEVVIIEDGSLVSP